MYYLSSKKKDGCAFHRRTGSRERRLELPAEWTPSAAVATSEYNANATNTELLELFVEAITIASCRVVALRTVGDWVYERAVCRVGELRDPSGKIWC